MGDLVETELEHDWSGWLGLLLLLLVLGGLLDSCLLVLWLFSRVLVEELEQVLGWFLAKAYLGWSRRTW